MSVVIRLTRTGKTHNISYRLVATDTHNKRDGKFLEILGFYNPKNGTAESFKLKKERYDFWLSKGAKPSPAVAELVLTGGKPKPRVNKKKLAAKTKKEAEAKAQQEAQAATPPAQEAQDQEKPAETTEPAEAAGEEAEAASAQIPVPVNETQEPETAAEAAAEAAPESAPKTETAPAADEQPASSEEEAKQTETPDAK